MTRQLGMGLCVALLMACAAMSATAQSAASVRVDGEESRIEDFGSDLHVELALSRAVHWRAYTLDAPRRLVLDFTDVDVTDAGLSEILSTDHVSALHSEPARAGGSRLIFELSEPFEIETAGLAPLGGGAVLKLQLAPTDARRFAETAGAPEGVVPPEAPSQAERARRALRVALDTGPGGDGDAPDLAHAFVRTLDRELSEAGISVIRTQRGAGHVTPRARLRVARAAEADLLVSLSPPTESQAPGARVYTRKGPVIRTPGGGWQAGGARPVAVALEMAWPETRPRSGRLADHLARGLSGAVDTAPAPAPLQATQPMLAAPDIPSALIGLGSRAAPDDLANLADPGWRRAAAAGIRRAIEAWAREGAQTGGTRSP